MHIRAAHPLTYRTVRAVTFAVRRWSWLVALAVVVACGGLLLGLTAGWTPTTVSSVVIGLYLLGAVEVGLLVGWRRVRGLEQWYELTDEGLALGFSSTSSSVAWTDVAAVEVRPAAWVFRGAATRVRFPVATVAFTPEQRAEVDAFVAERWPRGAGRPSGPADVPVASRAGRPER